MKKYKYDFIIILIIALIAIITIILLNLTSKSNNLIARVYHDDEIVLEISLDNLLEDTTYEVIGDISSVKILANKDGVRISESNCHDHICINQGFITNSNQSITCLPNRIYIILVGQEDMDIII